MPCYSSIFVVPDVKEMTLEMRSYWMSDNSDFHDLCLVFASNVCGLHCWISVLSVSISV